MRPAAFSALAAVTALIAACGSSSTAPVESASASGEVASAIADCPQGPPARDHLKTGDVDNAGVWGTLTNETTEPVFVANGWDRAPSCRLTPGASAAFAGSRWSVDVSLVITQEAKPGQPSGTNIGLKNVLFGGTPDVYSYASGSSGRIDCGSEDSSGRELTSGSSITYGSPVTGKVTVTRLANDSAAAREYVGIDSPLLDTWARIDVRIVRLGICS